MRIDASVANGDPTLAALIPEGVTVAHIIQLFQTAYPINGEQLLRTRLTALGAAHPANLALPELAEFIKYMLGALKSAGIRDPAAVLAHGVQLEAKEAAAKLGSSAGIGNIAAQPKSAERAPLTIENNSSTISVASPPRPGAPRTAAYGTTKAEVLSRTKVAVDAGEDPRHTAERLAYAQEDFRASQREIGRAIGRSASWVNRLLEWRRSGYKQTSPFGPTTRAGRAAHRNINNNNFGRGGGADGLLFGAAETGPNCEISCSRIREDGSDSGAASPVDRCSASYQPASLSAPGNEILPSASIQIGQLADGDAAAREPEGSKTQAIPLENADRERDSSGSRQLEQQKRPSENPKASQKRSPELMRIVVDWLKQDPTLESAAFKAGIHRKTLAYWLKCSAAGHEGYDIECDGERYRFHDLCEFAIAEADDTLRFLIWQIAMGIRFKIDPLLEKRGYRGADAYAKDENGDFIEEGDRKPNTKMMLAYLVWKRPERYGKPRKRDIARTGGVLVIGERRKRPKTSYAASIRARKWKAAFRKLPPL